MSYESTYVCLYVCTYEYVRTCQVKKGPYKGTYLCMKAFWIKCRGYKRTKLVKYFYGFINPVTGETSLYIARKALRHNHTS